MAAEKTLRVLLIESKDTDHDDFLRAVRSLSARLRELPIEALEVVREEEIPAGAKGGVALSTGELILTILSSSGVLAAILQVVQARLSDRRVRTVRLEMDGDVLEVDGISRRQQSEMIAQWLKRHAGDE